VFTGAGPGVNANFLVVGPSELRAQTDAVYGHVRRVFTVAPDYTKIATCRQEGDRRDRERQMREELDRKEREIARKEENARAERKTRRRLYKITG